MHAGIILDAMQGVVVFRHYGIYSTVFYKIITVPDRTPFIILHVIFRCKTEMSFCQQRNRFINSNRY